MVVALVQSVTVRASGINLDENLTIHQQSQKLRSHKIIVPTKLADLLRCGQSGDGGHDVRIVNCALARGDSKTMLWPRRRKYANRDRATKSESPSGDICGQ